MVSDVGQVFGVGVEGLDVGIGADNDNVPNSGKRNKKIPIRRGSALLWDMSSTVSSDVSGD